MIDNSEIEKQQDADKKNWFSEIDSKYQYVKPESYTPLKSDQESNLRKIVTLVIAAIIIVGALSFFIVYMYQEPQKKLEQRTLYVGGTEVERYARIQDAINASNDGDTVYVHIGTYYENLVINQSINLVGENKNKTVIDGDGIGITAKIMADNVNISGFTIRDCGSSWSEFNGSSIFDAGLYVLSDNNVIYKNIIESNSNDGIAIKHSSNNTIFNNQIINNMYDGIICRESCNFNKIYSNSISENGKNGIFLTDGCQNCLIYYNVVTDNGYSGISLQFSSNNSVFSNDIRNNAIGCSYECGGINLYSYNNNNNISKNLLKNNKYGFYLGGDSYNNVISSNTILDNIIAGIKIYASPSNDIVNNSLYNNNFVNDNQVYLALYENASCVNSWDNGNQGNYWSDYTGADEDNDGIGDKVYKINNNNNTDRFPLSAPMSNKYYVDDDYDSSTLGYGSDHFSNIQNGIDRSIYGDTIYVNSGIYYENIIIDKAVSLVGENKNTTIIDGSLGGKYVINISSDFVNINGFTIQNNYVDLGSGIYIDSNNNFISDNNIKNNTNGIFINSYSSYSYSNSNNICNNIIEDNRFAGIYAYRLIYTNITANTISGNKNEGICIRDSSNNNIISKNIIIKNNGIGIYLMFYSKNNNFCNNTISNNSGGITLQFNCNYNKIFRNNFINNTYNNANDYCTNTWYNLTITEGNYWSDYSEKYPNATGSNGIWDMPYNITGGENQDKYPLMRPYS